MNNVRKKKSHQKREKAYYDGSTEMRSFERLMFGYKNTHIQIKNSVANS